MEFVTGARKRRHVVDLALGVGETLAQPGVIIGGGVDGGEFRRMAFDGALRVHDLGGG